MRYISMMLVILFVIGCSKQDGVKVDTEEYTLTNYDGAQLATKVNADNLPIEKGTMSHGVRNGVWQYFNEKGELSKLETYVNGALLGPTFTFTNRGIIDSRTDYVNNTLHGNVIKYKNGRITEKSQFIEGQLDGDYSLYHDYSDKLQKSIQFKEGKQHGSLRYYDKEGNVTLEYNYKNGEKISGGIVNKKEE